MVPVVGCITVMGVVFAVAALMDVISSGRGEDFDHDEYHRMCSADRSTI